jgi:hypothetical protein
VPAEGFAKNHWGQFEFVLHSSDETAMQIRSSWNGIILGVTTIVGATAGIFIGRFRNAALLRQAATPANTTDILDPSGADAWFFTLMDAALGASVAMTILAPSFIVATIFQVREMARQAQQRSHHAMQQAFPHGPSSGKAPPAGSGTVSSNLLTAKKP